MRTCEASNCSRGPKLAVSCLPGQHSKDALAVWTWVQTASLVTVVPTSHVEQMP